MIEIIREEESSGTTERRALPKDIKQMGKPDIGDRIYVENEVYQMLHPYSNVEEKCAYVLLGRFENYAGRECVFVDAAILLEEITFDGDLPLWNDQTWAYIYKQLRHEFDRMVIVGWAMDIKGQLPNMTSRLEELHQNNFGGTHQILFLMDSLEREEAFYGNKNGHLCRREGFYVYYDKRTMPYVNGEPCIESEEEPACKEYEANEEEETSNDPWDWRSMGQKRPQGRYRQQEAVQKEHHIMPSYTSTFLLAMVVCALGVGAYLNNEKMRAMEETLAQMNHTQIVETQTEEMQTAQPEVAIENVAGNVQKQEETVVSEETVVPSANIDSTVNTAQQTPASEVQNIEPIQNDSATQNIQTEKVPTAEGDTKIPDPPVEASTTTVMTEAQTYLNQGYYIVQKGESLVGICKKIYQTTAMMDKLCEVNGIEDADAIYAGQRLILPN